MLMPCLLGSKFKTRALLMFCPDATDFEESLCFCNCRNACQVSEPSFNLTPKGSFTSRLCICQSVRHTGRLIHFNFFLSEDLKLQDCNFRKICLEKHFIAFESSQYVCSCHLCLFPLRNRSFSLNTLVFSV